MGTRGDKSSKYRTLKLRRTRERTSDPQKFRAVIAISAGNVGAGRGYSRFCAPRKFKAKAHFKIMLSGTAEDELGRRFEHYRHIA